MSSIMSYYEYYEYYDYTYVNISVVGYEVLWDVADPFLVFLPCCPRPLIILPPYSRVATAVCTPTNSVGKPSFAYSLVNICCCLYS